MAGTSDEKAYTFDLALQIARKNMVYQSSKQTPSTGKAAPKTKDGPPRKEPQKK